MVFSKKFNFQKNWLFGDSSLGAHRLYVIFNDTFVLLTYIARLFKILKLDEQFQRYRLISKTLFSVLAPFFCRRFHPALPSANCNSCKQTIKIVLSCLFWAVMMVPIELYTLSSSPLHAAKPSQNTKCYGQYPLTKPPKSSVNSMLHRCVLTVLFNSM